MGRQINFFLHQDDQLEFDTLLKSFGEIVLLPYYHQNNVVSQVTDTLIRDVKKEGRRVYLVRKEDLHVIRLTHIANFGYWLVDDRDLPVVHFDRGACFDGRIEQGRLYFQADFVDRERMIMRKKPVDFIDWADKILRTVRRKLKKHKHTMGHYNYIEYLGTHAQRWLEINRAEVGAAGSELRSTFSE